MKKLTRQAAMAALLVTPAFANPIDQIRPDAPQLADYGTLDVGVRTLSIVIPDQIDVAAIKDETNPRYDRPLTLEVWYPAAQRADTRGSYTANLRDGKTQVTLTGRAIRDAAVAEGTAYPLVVLSHGYPGNRYLMSPLAENLASKGFVTVSIDHTDSTYADQTAFGSTLLNRPLDIAAVIDHMATQTGPLGDIINSDVVGVIGYSMGGYGALVFGGAGVTQEATEFTWGAPNGLLSRYLAGSESHEALFDPRVRAVIAIGPWGRNAGLWDAWGLSGLRVPTLFMAGSADDVSVYEAIRTIFDEATGVDRHLLTFINGNHNTAAPMPAPREAWAPSEDLDFSMFDHYADPVWDTVRMNNIAQHFSTAFFSLHLKGDVGKRPFLELIPNGEDGVIALDEEAKPTEDHTYWVGFAPRTARGLRFESKREGE